MKSKKPKFINVIPEGKSVNLITENEFREMQELFSNMVNEIVNIKSAIQSLKIENENLKTAISILQNEKPKTKK